MPHRTAQTRIEELLAAVRAGLGLDLAFVGEFVNDQRVFRVVSGSLGRMQIEPGVGEALDQTYCVRVVDGRLFGAVPDAETHPEAAALPATQDGVRSHVGVPLYLSDGRLFGTLCAAGTSTRHDLDESSVKFLQSFATVIANEIEAALHESHDFDARAEYVRKMIVDRDFSIFVQPVVDLGSGATVAVEALTRFHRKPYRPPNEVFADAWAAGLGPDLEMAAIEEALKHLPRLDPAMSLSVNVSPPTILTDAFFARTKPCGRRLVVEVTEHAAVEDYAELAPAIERLTDVGIRLAIDDVGAGYSNLKHILELSPDVLKLDNSLTHDIAGDGARQAMVSALVSFAARVEAHVIAEGIETQEDFDALRLLEVRFGQGYLMGKPEDVHAYITGSQLDTAMSPQIA